MLNLITRLEVDSSEFPRDVGKLFRVHFIVRAGHVVCPRKECNKKMGAKPNAYERRLQLKHFFEDRETKETRRTWLEIQVAMPEQTDEGWVNDGKIRLSIGEDRNIKGSFLLSIEEATRLLKALEIAVTDHEAEKAALWRK